MVCTKNNDKSTECYILKDEILNLKINHEKLLTESNKIIEKLNTENNNTSIELKNL